MVSTKSPVPAASATAPTPNALQALGRHFAPEVCEAYTRFQQTRSAADVDIVVFAIVWDHMPNHALRPDVLPEKLSLVADLGFDSVSITEMVFFLEDLFQLRITNEEILRVRTVGDLRTFVRRKLLDSPALTSSGA